MSTRTKCTHSHTHAHSHTRLAPAPTDDNESVALGGAASQEASAHRRDATTSAPTVKPVNNAVWRPQVQLGGVF